MTTKTFYYCLKIFVDDVQGITMSNTDAPNIRTEIKAVIPLFAKKSDLCKFLKEGQEYEIQEITYNIKD